MSDTENEKPEPVAEEAKTDDKGKAPMALTPVGITFAPRSSAFGNAVVDAQIAADIAKAQEVQRLEAEKREAKYKAEREERERQDAGTQAAFNAHGAEFLWMDLDPTGAKRAAGWVLVRCGPNSYDAVPPGTEKDPR